MIIKIFKKYYIFHIIFALIFVFTFLKVIYNKKDIEIFSYIFQTKFKSIPTNEIQTYVLTLDRTPDRYNKVQEQLNNRNILHKKFSAIDGYDLEIVDQKTGKQFSAKDLKEGKIEIMPNQHYKIVSPLCNIEYFSKPFTEYFKDYEITRLLTPGEFGCLCSHREIWKDMILNNNKYALILEDDIIFLDGFQSRFDNLINNLPSNWDIIYLFVMTVPKKQVFHILNNSNLKKFKADGNGITSTTAYLINIDAARKLLKLSTNFSYAVDDFISDQINMKYIEAYRTSEHYIYTPVGENAKDSTIYQMGRPHF